MATFLLAGLWHGAAWNFVLWGAFHGVLVLGHRELRSVMAPKYTRCRIGTIASISVTFVLMSVSWLLFREGDASHIWSGLTASPLSETSNELEVAAFLFFQVVIYSLPLWLHAMYSALASSSKFGAARYASAHKLGIAVATTVFFTGILAMRNGEGGEFIYFRF